MQLISKLKILHQSMVPKFLSIIQAFRIRYTNTTYNKYNLGSKRNFEQTSKDVNDKIINYYFNTTSILFFFLSIFDNDTIMDGEYYSFHFGGYLGYFLYSEAFFSQNLVHIY